MNGIFSCMYTDILLWGNRIVLCWASAGSSILNTDIYSNLWIWFLWTCELSEVYQKYHTGKTPGKSWMTIAFVHISSSSGEYQGKISNITAYIGNPLPKKWDLIEYLIIELPKLNLNMSKLLMSHQSLISLRVCYKGKIYQFEKVNNSLYVNQNCCFLCNIKTFNEL